MSAGERTRVGAYAICLDDTGRILLCRIAPWVLRGEVWTLPDVSDRLFSGSSDGPEGADGPMHAIRIVYRVRIIGGALRDEVDGSTDTCAWFTLEAAGRLHLASLARSSLRIAAAHVPAQSA